MDELVRSDVLGRPANPEPWGIYRKNDESMGFLGMSEYVPFSELTAIQRLWRESKNLGIKAVGGIFYFYERSEGNLAEINHQVRVILPIDFAINLDIQAGSWIAEQQQKLAQNYATPAWSFGVTNKLFSEDELTKIATLAHNDMPEGVLYFAGDQQDVLDHSLTDKFLFLSILIERESRVNNLLI